MYLIRFKSTWRDPGKYYEKSCNAAVYSKPGKKKGKSILGTILGLAVLIGGGYLLWKYVLKKEPQEHLHFKCTKCRNISCLADIQISGYELPQGYKKIESNFLIIGICNECNN